MDIEIVYVALIIGLCSVCCVGIWRIGSTMSEANTARIQQEGITLRAREKLATAETAAKHEEWYVPILTQLASSPEVQKMLIEKFAPMIAQGSMRQP